MKRLFSLQRWQKRAIQIAYDLTATSLVVILLWFVTYSSTASVQGAIAVAVVLAAPVLMNAFGAYRAILRYLPASFIGRFLFVAFGLSCFSFALHLAAGHQPGFRIHLDLFSMLFLVLCAPRLALRWWVEHQVVNDQQRAIVYGAGSAGRQLVSALVLGQEYRPVAFVDDDPALAGATIMGLPICRPSALEDMVPALKASVVLLAMPSASINRRRAIVQRLEALPLRVQSIPGMADVASGKAQISELRDVSVEDLLGRDAVKPFGNLIGANITGKSVMVTGAGGSIGSELARQALAQRPRKLVLFERAEYALYSIEAELQKLAIELKSNTKIIAVLGSVSNGDRMHAVLANNSVQTVYHAAAYKHVPLVEHNPLEGARNNVMGTWRAANAAVAAGVEAFVLISTDKAVRPTNVMGATKRFAELGIQALAKNTAGVKFSIVRFGNVLGSSGSVVPKFREQIAAGGPITVTHPEIIRYFMTIPEAAQLVIQAGALGGSGEVFVLDMGESVKIVDLASRMIRLAGQSEKTLNNPTGDIEIKFTGLRPGEKLFEELLINDSDTGTEHPRIKVSAEPMVSHEEYEQAIDRLRVILTSANLPSLRELLIDLPLAWAPDAEVLEDYGFTGKVKPAISQLSGDLEGATVS